MTSAWGKNDLTLQRDRQVQLRYTGNVKHQSTIHHVLGYRMNNKGNHMSKDGSNLYTQYITLSHIQ